LLHQLLQSSLFKESHVPLALARQFEKEMKQKDMPLTVYIYNEGIHGFWNDPVFWKRVQKFVTEP
jgi:hypothetical protein